MPSWEQFPVNAVIFACPYGDLMKQTWDVAPVCRALRGIYSDLRLLEFVLCFHSGRRLTQIFVLTLLLGVMPKMQILHLNCSPNGQYSLWIHYKKCERRNCLWWSINSSAQLLCDAWKASHSPQQQRPSGHLKAASADKPALCDCRGASPEHGVVMHDRLCLPLLNYMQMTPACYKAPQFRSTHSRDGSLMAAFMFFIHIQV